MITTDSRQKVQTPSIEPSVKHPTGAVITTFKPPPADFDPMTADPATLRNYGYPPRPRDLAALARWRELLGRPLRSIRTTITKRTHRDRRVRFTEGTEAGPNWSGAVVFSNGSDTLFMVSGQWRIPDFKAFTVGGERDASVWIGLDGDGTDDVFQAGIHAVMNPGDNEPNLYAWFEWFPDAENAIDLPVAEGDTMTCVITADDDCLPIPAVQIGAWETIKDDHQLIVMHDGKVLDWEPGNGKWRLWSYDPTSTDVLPSLVSSGQWQTVRDGHSLIPMHDGKVLDWEPANGKWRLWRYDPSSKSDCLPGDPVSHGQWQTVRDGHVLVPMKDGKVIDWVPNDGTWRLWNYDPTNSKDCLPAPEVSSGHWISLDASHTLVPMHDGRVLDWTTDGSWRLWNYDPTNKQDCLPANAVAVGQWISVNSDHTLVPMHDGRVLDWTTDGSWRLWNYDPDGHSAVAGTIVLRNETQGLQTTHHLQAPDGVLMLGKTAEWIVERPAQGSDLTLTTLLNYGSVKFTHAFAERTSGQVVKASDGDTINMTEDGKVVSKGSASGETVTCTFV